MRVFIQSLGDGYETAIARGFEFLGPAGTIRTSDRIAIKPNLTFPTYRPGVMTSLEALIALVTYLKNFTDNITICESDSGGYNPFSMDEVFRNTGITEFAHRMGVRIVNMSHTPSRPIRFRRRFRTMSVPLPTLLLDETDLFITMPVPKVHMNTIVSLGLKNQWGVIQEPALRLKLHPFFKEVIYQVNKALPKTVVVVDGKYGLTRSGPMRGDVLDLNWILISDNLFASDRIVSEMMGFDWRSIPYIRYALKREEIRSVGEIQFNCDYKAFRNENFYLVRQWTDYPGVMTFNSRALAYFGYESILAKPLHWLLYRFREPFY